MDRSKFTEAQLRQIDKSRAYWGTRLEDELRAISDRKEADLHKLLKKEYRRSQKVIQDAVRELYADMVQGDGVISVTKMYQYRRYSKLMKALNEEMRRLGGKEVEIIKRGLIDAYKDTFGSVTELFENIEQFDFNMLSEKQVETLVNTKWLGRNYADSVWANKENLINAIEKNIRNSITLGYSHSKATSAIMLLTGSSYRNVDRLVRTEVMHILTTTADSVAKDARWGYKQWLTAKDERTCEVCKLLEDEVFPVDSQVYSHPMCRCTFIYIKNYNPNGVPVGEEVEEVEPLYNDLKECYKKASFNGIDKDYAEEMKARFLDLQNKYPILQGEIEITTSKSKTAFGYNSSNIVGTKVKGVQHAQYAHKISISNYHMSDKANSVYLHNKNYISRKSKLEKSLDGLTTLDHEYGHAIDTAYTLAKRKDLQDMKLMYKDKIKLGYDNIKEVNAFNHALHEADERLSATIWNKMQGELGISRVEMTELVRKEFGSYASSEQAEFLAEGFANIRLLPKDRYTDFIKRFDEIFNEEFDKVLR